MAGPHADRPLSTLAALAVSPVLLLAFLFILLIPIFLIAHLAFSGPAFYPIVVVSIAIAALGVARHDAEKTAARMRHPEPDSANVGAVAGLWALLVGLAAASPVLLPSLVLRRVMRLFRDPDAIDRYFSTAFSKEIVGGALAALAVVVAGLVLGTIWRRRQARLVLELPTSRARSVAIGPVELRGIARHPRGGAPGRAHGPLMWLGEDCPMRFDLEDATGRILVDASGARIRAVWRLFDPRVCEVALARLAADDTQSAWMLRDGDPVYVLGYAERRAGVPASAIDSDALVVRPLLEPAPYGPVRYLFGAAPKALLRDFRHVFFVSNTDEADARRHVLRGIRHLWEAGALLCGLIALVIWLEFPYAADRYGEWPMDLVAVYAPDDVKVELLFPRILDPDPAIRDEALRWVTRERPWGFQWQGKYYLPRTPSLRRYAEPLLAMARERPALRSRLLFLLSDMPKSQDVWVQVCYELLVHERDILTPRQRDYYEINLAFSLESVVITEEMAAFLATYPRTVVRQSLAEDFGYSRQHAGGKLAPWQIALLERLAADADPKVSEAARKARQRAIDRKALAP